MHAKFGNSGRDVSDKLRLTHLQPWTSTILCSTSLWASTKPYRVAVMKSRDSWGPKRYE